MKNLLVLVFVVLFAANLKAQDTGTGAPKELTCTEKAFNFSFSVGQKLKLSAAKMGPLEAASYQTDYMPAWALKVNAMKAEQALPSASLPVNSFKVSDKNKDLFPAMNFNQFGVWPSFNYKPLKPFSF